MRVKARESPKKALRGLAEEGEMPYALVAESSDTDICDWFRSRPIRAVDYLYNAV